MLFDGRWGKMALLIVKVADPWWKTSLASEIRVAIHVAIVSVTGWRGARTRESCRPRPHPRPELVPGPAAAPQALRRVRRPGLGHRAVPGRRCVYPRRGAAPGQQRRPFSSVPFLLTPFDSSSVSVPLFDERDRRSPSDPRPGAQPLQLHQGGRGLCVSRTRETLFQTDPGVQASVNHPHKPRRQATGWFHSRSFFHLEVFEAAS